MLKWADIHKKISKDSNEFSVLQNVFNSFFTHVETQVNDPILKSKGIHVEKIHSDFFTSNFAGRDLTFVFTALFTGSVALTGRVTCYMKSKYPEEKFIIIDSFDFNTSGITNLIIEEDDNDPVQLNSDIHAPCVYLDILHKSLSY